MKFSQHLKALMRKNYILWKRNMCCSIFEVLLPFWLVSTFFIIRSLTSDDKIETTSYLSSAYILPADYQSIGTYPQNGSLIPPYMKNCLTASASDQPTFRNGHVATIGPDSILNQIENIFTTNFKYPVQRYNSVDEMNEYISSSDYNHDICLGISIDSYQNNQYQYQLFFNASQTDPEVPQTNQPSKIAYLYENIDNFLDPYVDYGFLTLQNWIDNVILQQATGNNNLQINAQISSMTVAQHYDNPLVTYLKGNMGVYIVLPMILIYLRMTYGLLIEKEKKIREGMKVMGMSDASFYVSWIIYYLIIYVLTSLLVATVLKMSIYQSSSWMILFIWHLLFGIALIFQSLFITTFFTRAQIGNIFAMVFFFVQYMITFILQANPNPSASTKTSLSIFPHVGMVLACDTFLISESSKLGIQWSSISTEYDNYNITSCIGMTCVNIVLFALLAIYFDQVFPNDFGKKRHPLFFINWIWKKNTKEHHIKQPLLNDSEIHMNFEENFEDVPKNLQDQEQQNLVVKLDNVRKVYPSGKKAVNGLSFSMFNGQIFALLGHNGAGKTSTISMLTGMYEMSEGYATAFGKDVSTEMQEIRTFMGVCPQYDILFDYLSVKEHLELFATFKGMTDKNEIQSEVIKHIEDVDLQEKTNELAKNLSGGQRRRLSVAIAFIGGSKLVYLDEPTSGMDTSARRHVWDMLKRYKNDRIICLTTHFMDEADYLGDRIGIMADGQLVCMGRPLFLKNKFGAGYNLTIVKKNPTDDSKPIQQLIKAHVNTAIVLSDVSSEVVFQLQNEQASNFPALFKELDNSLDKLSIQTYGISITTLEEVFLSVGNLKEEKLLKERSIQRKSKGRALSDIKIDIENQKQMNSEEEEIDNFDLNSVRITQKHQLFLYHMKALIIKRLICFKRDIRSLMCEVILPCLIVLGGLSMTLIKFDSNQEPVLMTPTNFSPPVTAIIGSNPSISAATLTSIENSFRQQSLYSFNSALNLTPNQWDQDVFSQKTEDTSGSWYVQNVQDNTPMSYIAEINSIYRDAAPLYINQMNEALINYQLSLLGKSSITLQITNSPFPLTQQEKDEASTIVGIVACFVYAMAFSFIPASLITFSVKERTEKIKHQQLVSGVSLFSYWFSNFFIDFMKHVIPAVFSIIMILIYNIDSFTQSTCLSAVSLMMFLYGWSIIPFSYILGFLFENYGNAQVSVFFLNYLCGGILPLIVFILKQINSTQFIGYTAYLFRFIPSFSFGYGILSVSNRTTIAYQNGQTTPSSAYSFSIAGADILYMSLEGIGYVLLLFFIENSSRFTSLNKLFTKESDVKYIPKEYDEDVQREIDLVEQTKPEDYTVRVNKLRKVFIPAKDRVKVAVDQISFGIGNGECFTLLGVNGAGKTTTFKILSGEIQQTSGECHIQGYDLITQLHEARNYIGYCPQFDALCENLTAREHLEMYALIKGIPIEMREQLIVKKIKEMDLTEFENKLAGTYSGGNKRKLSVAIAMLGNPPIVFLDEPSTGMDPGARRFMWDVISRISTQRKSSSVILTTHSMEEAEALSTKIAIQVEGQLKCIGTIQQIKDKFGQGYEVEIKLKVPQDNDILGFLAEKGIHSHEELQNNIHYSDLQKYLEKMDASNLQAQIEPKGESSQIYYRLNSTKGIGITSLAQFIILENNGQNVKDFIQRNLGEFSIIEHFDDFYRFRIESKITIGSMFEAFEKNKTTLQIDNYSVKQATIEQIFNLFATDQIKVNEQKNKISSE